MRRLITTLLATTVVGCAGDAQLSQPLSAPRDGALSSSQLSAISKYDLSILATLGGTSRGDAINERGDVAGYSTLPGNSARHAALWRDGTITDLGTLGGPNSSVVWPGINARGTVVGISELAAIDPLGEAWSCSAFFPSVTHHVCRGFAWEAGTMRALPTLGGNNGFTAGINSRGQIVGWAETTVHDPTCVAPQVLQFRAVLWDAKSLAATQLAPLAGDSTSAATAINERGQVVGISGDCGVAVGGLSARHAVLWDRGTVTDIGNLGGSAWNTPMAINASGDVVGFSDRPGDSAAESNEHAFLWTSKDGIRDLGTLPGDQTSQALDINALGQIVGTSCGATGCRAFLWEKGVMTNLNDVVTLAAGDQLTSAQSINNAGQITGRILHPNSGATRLAFIATPTGERR